MTRSEIHRRLTAIVSEQLGVDESEVLPLARLRGDLEADSLDQVCLTMALEEEFGVDIHDADSRDMQTIGDVLDYLCMRFQAERTGEGMSTR